MRCRYREYSCRSGIYLDGKILPTVSDTHGKGKRRARFRPTTEAQARLNEWNALRRAARIIEDNFSEADVMLTPTFRDATLPDDDEALMRVYNNFVRRLRRKYAARGAELKIFTVVGRGEKTGRYHVHMVVNGGVLTDDEIRAVWGLGWVTVRPLEFDETGLSGLSNYMGGHRIGMKRFFHSRNLRLPQVVERDRQYSQRQVAELASAENREYWEKRYPGYRLIGVEPYFNPIDAKWYISFRMWKPPARWLREAKADGRITPEEYRRWQRAKKGGGCAQK